MLSLKVNKQNTNLQFMSCLNLLLDCLVADTAKIVLEYAHELRGNLVCTRDLVFDCVVAQGQDCLLGAKSKHLHYICKNNTKVDVGSPVFSLLALSNGDVACGTEDGVVKVFRDQKLHFTLKLEGRCGLVTAMAELAENKIVVGLSDGQIFLWSRGVSKKLTNNYCIVTGLLPLSDEHFLFCDENGKVCKSRAGVWIQSFDRHTHFATSMVRIGGKIVSACLDGNIHISESGKPVKLIAFHSPVLAMCVLPDGRLVVGCDNQEVTIWDPVKCVKVQTVQKAKRQSLSVRGRKLNMVVLGKELVVSDGARISFFE